MIAYKILMAVIISTTMVGIAQLMAWQFKGNRRDATRWAAGLAVVPMVVIAGSARSRITDPVLEWLFMIAGTVLGGLILGVVFVWRRQQ